MPSPLLNEPEIMQALSRKVTMDDLDNIRLGVMLATIDGRDRKITREPFVDLVNSGFNLTCLLGRIYAYNYVKQLQMAGQLDQLDELVSQLTVHAEAFKAKLCHQMELIAQCPQDEDSKH